MGMKQHQAELFAKIELRRHDIEKQKQKQVKITIRCCT